ncbi:nucleotidyltransferase domain-containing protein [Kribbella sp. NPDC051620]|uniref:nucleotidyltransferase domain-containing protein n=1 Tax=Kribbella sp. NPDC051620 TaxID=3364120 RepID=UPI0037B3690C
MTEPAPETTYLTLPADGGGPVLPVEVSATTTRYLELIDQALPEQVTGLYLTGSIPLGDYRRGFSDIDAVVVVASPLTDVEVVRAVHKQLPSSPAFDVTYLTAADLAVAPDATKPVVFTLDGEFKQEPSGGPVSPVLWSELARQSTALRSVPDLVVHDDQEALEAFTRANLTSYWAGRFDALESAFADHPDDEVVDAWILPWVMLGVPRLHALLATGNIISKTGAGEHALIAFPEWSPLLHRCLDHRAGKPETFTVTDARSAVPYGRKVITTALAL